MMNTTTEHGYAAGRARRDQIIAEATVLFGRLGFHSTTVVEIAAQCGISRAGLLHHFPTKESLLAAVLEERDREDRARFRQNGSASRDGISVLRGMVDLASYNSSLPGIIALYAVLSAEATAEDHPAHAYFTKRYERIRSETRIALEQAKAAGHLVDGVDIPAAAIELTALMDGLQVQWLLAPHRVDMAQQLHQRIQQLLVTRL
ncbi:MAG TPA: TetR/AcrR family transcriptional regulator [Lacisediminihabitans sp.]|uniref:TetR/AcrR family transcriptional regulator n=1 Tax=Lacisediminihabitans sp. TaxID=2787631 RepID=UPI002ED91487